MNPDHPSPEDRHQAPRLTRVEQQLKKLQPRPAAFNAESILSAARVAEGQFASTRRAVRKKPNRRGWWLAVPTAFACGTIAGVLLTCFVFPRNVGGDLAKSTDEKGPPASESAPNAAETPGPNVPSGPQWSRGERFVAAQMRDIRRPRLMDEPPLRAGNFVLPPASAVPRPEDFAVRGPKETPDPPRSSTNAPPNTRPIRPIDRGHLLRELLGVGSRL